MQMVFHDRHNDQQNRKTCKEDERATVGSNVLWSSQKMRREEGKSAKKTRRESKGRRSESEPRQPNQICSLLRAFFALFPSLRRILPASRRIFSRTDTRT
jgi:hypothetical protein